MHLHLSPQAAAMHRMAQDPEEREDFSELLHAAQSGDVHAPGRAEGVLVALADELTGSDSNLQVRARGREGVNIC